MTTQRQLSLAGRPGTSFEIVELTVNGARQAVAVRPNRTLLDLLRLDLGLTGTKQGCGEGDCGSCTVLLDGEPVNACLVLALEAAGAEVTTIEGMASGAELHPLQRAFIEVGAVQCGFCTPGMLLVAKSVLDRNPQPSQAEVRRAISGNLCRCTGYQKIVEGVLLGAELLQGRRLEASRSDGDPSGSRAAASKLAGEEGAR